MRLKTVSNIFRNELAQTHDEVWGWRARVWHTSDLKIVITIVNPKVNVILSHIYESHCHHWVRFVNIRKHVKWRLWNNDAKSPVNTRRRCQNVIKCFPCHDFKTPLSFLDYSFTCRWHNIQPKRMIFRGRELCRGRKIVVGRIKYLALFWVIKIMATCKWMIYVCVCVCLCWTRI